MIGILVQLLVSWLLLWLFQKKGVAVLGLKPTQTKVAYFVLFLAVTACCCALGFFMKMLFAQQRWMLNPNLDAALVWDGIWWNLKSVLFEELAFRGAVLYILIQRIGAAKAIVISSVAFGMYHWFSQGSFGNPVQMLVTFLATGSMGLILAYGFIQSNSLYIPIAVHFGWNYTQQSIFSNGPIGNQVFIPVLPQPVVTVSYIAFFSMLLLPLMAVLGINYWLMKKMAAA